MKYQYVYGLSLTIIAVSIMAFAFHNLPYSHSQPVRESATQEGLFEATESPRESGSLCPSVESPGLFIPCEFPVTGASNKEFCESERQPGLWILCPSVTPKLTYCQSEDQPGLYVICFEDGKLKPNATALEKRIGTLENKVENITLNLNQINKNLNISGTNR